MDKIENIGFDNLIMVQDADGFKFGIDAVLLADFVSAVFLTGKKDSAKASNTLEIADLGTGNGIVPLVLSHKVPNSKITGIDVQERAIELAKNNAKINNLEDRLEFVLGDVKSIREDHSLWSRRFDIVVSNPPYVTRGGGMNNSNSAKFIARQETTASLEDFIETAAWMLKDRGHFFMVHRPSRLVDIFYYCRKHRLEPKDIRLVSPREGKEPNILLLHCCRDGGVELNIMKNLYVYTEKGEYTREILDIYEKY